MSRKRNRGANNTSRAAQRRAAAGHGKPSRPGVAKQKSLSKALGPKAQQAARKAAQMTKAGEHEGAARIYRKIGDHLKDEGSPALASRAYLRCARSLHNAGRKEGAHKAFDAALEQASQCKQRKAALVHFQDLVRRLRRNGNDEAADKMTARIKEAMGRQNLGRKKRRNA